MRLTDEGDRPVIWLRDELARAAEIERELEAFEREERARLGLTEVPVAQWRDPAPRPFTRDERAGTTLLCGGLTQAQDLLIQGALRGIGYRVEVLGTPDDEALRVGREFGNRGQCNPTYFTVGNLVHHLQRLRDEQGLSPREIIARHVFVTAGACGPCRFAFEIDPSAKAMLAEGLDAIDLTLKHRHAIAAFQARDGEARPWVYLESA